MINDLEDDNDSGDIDDMKRSENSDVIDLMEDEINLLEQ